MAITNLPTVGGNLGPVKSNRRPVTDIDRQITADEWNVATAAIEAVVAEVGLSDGSTAGSINAERLGNAAEIGEDLADGDHIPVANASAAGAVRKSLLSRVFAYIAQKMFTQNEIGRDLRASDVLVVLDTDGTPVQKTANVARVGTLASSPFPHGFPSAGTLQRFTIVDECLTPGNGFAGLLPQVDGAGATVTSGAAPAGRVGISRLATGTDANGRAALITGTTSIKFGGGQHRLRMDVEIPVASDVTDTFDVRVGFGDSHVTEHSDGVFFRYRYDVNGGRWEAVAREADVETAADTGVLAAAQGYQSLEVEVNAAGTEAKFYVDGSLVATVTTNIPITADRTTGLAVSILKSAGTTSRDLNLDCCRYEFVPTVAI